MYLITSRKFLPLFITQFLEAFNDNLLKNALVVLITFKMVLEPIENSQTLVTIAAGMFILPFFLFSASAGQLADKHERTNIIKVVKVFELIIAILSAIGLHLNAVWFLIFMLFAFGTHSTFFGPVKYAVLPQLIPTKDLILANAFISSGTFVAILLGTICGSLLIVSKFGVYIVSMLLISIAACGLIACFFIPKAPAPDPELRISHNFINETWRIIGYSRINRNVFTAILAISWFWFIGATFLAQLANYVKFTIHAESHVVTILLVLFTVGIGIGSFLCNQILKNKIKSTLEPYSLVAMSLAIIDLYFASKSMNFNNLSGLLAWQVFINMGAGFRIMFDLILIAICGGIYIVPLYATVQHESNGFYLARIIAANNVLNALFMVLSAIFTLALLALQCTISEIFLVIALLNIPVAFLLHKYLQ